MPKVPKFTAYSLGRALRKAREGKGLSQLQFAHKLGYMGGNAGAFISKAEAGTHIPRLPTLRRMAKTLGTTLDALCG